MRRHGQVLAGRAAQDLTAALVKRVHVAAAQRFLRVAVDAVGDESRLVRALEDELSRAQRPDGMEQLVDDALASVRALRRFAHDGPKEGGRAIAEELAHVEPIPRHEVARVAGEERADEHFPASGRHARAGGAAPIIEVDIARRARSAEECLNGLVLVVGDVIDVLLHRSGCAPEPLGQRSPPDPPHQEDEAPLTRPRVLGKEARQDHHG